MTILIKDIFGVVDGEVYPRVIAAGVECPPELEALALEQDALQLDVGKVSTPKQAAPAVAAAAGAPEVK